MIRLMLTAAALAASGLALAKLPAPDDATKAKAAEAAAKAGWQGKLDAYQTCKVQDRIAARYRASHPQATGPSAAVTASLAAASSSAAAKTPAAKPVPTAASVAQGGTPVMAVTASAPPATPCADPGPFAYAPPEQKPLETSGAHSPAANATSPPSVRAESATMVPAKPSTATRK